MEERQATKQATSVRLKPLESLRGFMALWVLLCHAIAGAGLDYQNWPKPLDLLGKGNLGVDVFIMLSGFVIFFLIDQKKENYWGFITRRAFRLFPVYLVCLAVSIPLVPLTIEALQVFPWPTAHNDLQLKIYLDTMNHYYAHLGLHLVLLQGLFDSVLPSASATFIGPAWSLSMEWQFYLVAPWIFSCLTQKRRLWMFILMGGTIFYAYAFPFGLGVMLGKLHYFMVGMLSYFLWTKRDFIFALSPRLAPLLVPVVLGLIVLITESVPLGIWAVVFLSMTVAEFSKGKLVLESALTRVLELPVFLLIGRLSYSIYLTHMLVLYGLMYLLRNQALNHKPYFLILLGAGTVITLAISYCLNRFVEMPFMKLGSKISR